MKSGFYAGRGPLECDLNSRILESFYKGIGKEKGKKAAVNFVRFVNKLGDLSASSFIVAFEYFWAGNCENIEVEQHKDDRVRLDAHGDALAAQGLAVLFAVASGEQGDEREIARKSRQIKWEFMDNHRKEIPEDER